MASLAAVTDNTKTRGTTVVNQDREEIAGITYETKHVNVLWMWEHDIKVMATTYMLLLYCEPEMLHIYECEKSYMTAWFELKEILSVIDHVIFNCYSLSIHLLLYMVALLAWKKIAAHD